MAAQIRVRGCVGHLVVKSTALRSRQMELVQTALVVPRPLRLRSASPAKVVRPTPLPPLHYRQLSSIAGLFSLNN